VKNVQYVKNLLSYSATGITKLNEKIHIEPVLEDIKNVAFIDFFILSIVLLLDTGLCLYPQLKAYSFGHSQ
jgi:Ni,Fe-hydrogenase I cytochrome b subunit